MPWSCAVLNCKSVYKKDGGIQFFGFPFKNQEILNKWIVAVGRKDFVPTKNNKVCGLHFDQKDYVVRPGASFNKLREYAVPWKRLSFKSVRNSPKETVSVGSPLSFINMSHDHDYLKKDKEDIHLDLAEIESQLKVDDISGIILVLSKKKILSAKFEDDLKFEKNEYVTQVENDKQEISVNKIGGEKLESAGESNKITEKQLERKLFQCSNCNKRFKFEELLKKHMLKTHYYYCTYCKHLFQNIIELKNHIKENHKDVDYLSTKPYFCDKCMEEFNCKYVLLKHLRTYHGAIQCRTCGRSFFSKDDLNQHRKTHPSSHICKICGRSFREKSSLKLHVEIHGCCRLRHFRDKLFKCDICGKAFSKKDYLMNHRDVHAREPRKPKHKKFSFLMNTDVYKNQPSCNICGRTVKNVLCLKNHRNIQARVRKFKCPENKYICPVCCERSKLR